MLNIRNQASSSLRSKQLGEILVEMGSITTDQLNQALDLQDGCDALLGALLVRMKFCNPDAISMALHKQIKITDVKLNRVKVDASAAALFDRAFCEENKLLPFELIGDLICVAMANPLNRGPVLAAQKKLAGQTIKVFRSPWPDIHKAIEPIYAVVAAKVETTRPRARSGPATTAVNRPATDTGRSHYAATATSQPGFERPLTSRTSSGPLVTGLPAAGEDGAAAPNTSPAAPDLPVVAAAHGPIQAPAIVVDDSWIETRQNPHIVFHQRMLKTMSELAAAPAFLRGGLEPALRRGMILALGDLLAEHGELLPQSIDFTLGPEQLKMLEWRALVLRGMFCYHLSYPYRFGVAPKAFTLHTPQDVVECYAKVREHFQLFQRELGSVNDQPDKLVHCSRAEIDHTLAHLERILMLLPPPAGAGDAAAAPAP